MKLCLVGYGAIAHKHMEAFRAMDDARPWVLVGRRAQPTAAFAEQWNFPHWTLNLDEALADPAIDAVVITSPNELHAEQATKALRAGKHVLVEIPLAMNLDDAVQVTQLARRQQRRLMVAHTMRYFPAIQEVRRRVVEENFKIHHIDGFFGLMRRTNVTSAGAPRSWTDSLLWHFGAHMIDVVLWVTGHTAATRMFCQFGPPHPTQGVMELSLCMTLPGGELVTIAQSYNVDSLRWKISFIGDRETLDFDNDTLYGANASIVVPPHSITDLSEQNAEFVAAIREDRDPAITGEDVLPAMRILQSAESFAATATDNEAEN